MTATRRWREQPVFHKQGALGIMVATVLFMVGFSVPAWTSEFAGLWVICSGSAPCSSNLYSHSGAWITVVRVMECLALLLYAFCALSGAWITVVRVMECLALLLYALCVLAVIREDFYLKASSSSISNKTIEILALLAGILSLTGAIIFGIQRSKDFKIPAPEARHQHAEQTFDLHLGFALTVTASIIILLSALTIGYSRCRRAHRQLTTKRASFPEWPAQNTVSEEQTSIKKTPDTCDLSSSMMLVPAGHFDMEHAPKQWAGKDPPPYALPPPYPYPSSYDFFLPLAHSSVLPSEVNVGTNKTTDVSSQVTMEDLSRLSAVVGYDSFPVECSTPAGMPICDPKEQRSLMKPLSVNVSDIGKDTETTSPLQSSTELPNPFIQSF